MGARTTDAGRFFLHAWSGCAVSWTMPAAKGAREVLMSLHGSVLAAARFRMWLQHPTGPEVHSGCVGWTQQPLANPLAYWVLSCLPEALAQQVKGVNWRWGLLIGDGNCFPLPLWARFFTKAIEDRDPISTGSPSMIPADDALRLLDL